MDCRKFTIFLTVMSVTLLWGASYNTVLLTEVFHVLLRSTAKRVQIEVTSGKLQKKETVMFAQGQSCDLSYLSAKISF